MRFCLRQPVVSSWSQRFSFFLAIHSALKPTMAELPDPFWIAQVRPLPALR